MTKKHSFVLITTGVVLFVFSILKIIQVTRIDNPTDNSNPSIESENKPIQNPISTSTTEILSDGQKRIIEDYLKVNLSLLSPKKEVLGGKFYLTNIKFIDDKSAIISYEDGHISLDARIKFFFIDNNPSLTEFTIIAENGQMYIDNSSSTSSSSTIN